jgi:hypothetical protein
VFNLDVTKVNQNVVHVGYTRMFEVYVPNVSSRFSDVCLQVFHLDVAYVFTHMKCFQVFFCKCFIRMFRVFKMFRTYVASVSSGCFKSRYSVTASVSDACFMCFIYLQTYVASVGSGCFKNRSGVVLPHLRLGISSSSRHRLDIRCPLPFSWMLA